MQKRRIKEIKYDIALIIIGSIAGLFLNISASAIYTFLMKLFVSKGFPENLSNLLLMVLPFMLAVFLFKDLFQTLRENSKDKDD